MFVVMEDDAPYLLTRLKFLQQLEGAVRMVLHRGSFQVGKLVLLLQQAAIQQHQAKIVDQGDVEGQFPIVFSDVQFAHQGIDQFRITTIMLAVSVFGGQQAIKGGYDFAKIFFALSGLSFEVVDKSGDAFHHDLRHAEIFFCKGFFRLLVCKIEYPDHLPPTLEGNGQQRFGAILATDIGATKTGIAFDILDQQGLPFGGHPAGQPVTNAQSGATDHFFV